MLKNSMFFPEAYQTLISSDLQKVEKMVSVSGISSGAYMASQYHISHSSYINAATLFAGGPYFCSQGNPYTALGLCMKDETGKINLESLKQKVKTLEFSKLIDSIENLKKSKLKVVSGKRDLTVRQRVSKSAVDFYKKLKVSDIQFLSEFDIAHTFPTIDKGNNCNSPSSSPFISSCEIDGAEIALSTSKDVLDFSGDVDDANFFKIDQWKVAPMSAFSMAQYAIAFVPDQCKEKSCSLHVAFHGCKQTRLNIDDQFIKDTGYANWAQGSDIIVLFPQTLPSFVNPNGCWDWWGYSSPLYHTKKGPQIQAVHKMVKKIFFK
jgi:hypothetical protein